MTKGRLEAFSDGVIAIIITIMVLELKVPKGADWAALRSALPFFSTYVLSYVFVGIYWNNHHHMLHAVTRIDGRVLWANLHLLFWLSLVPFATSWMGGNHLAPLPTAFYGCVLLLSGLAWKILQNTIIAVEGPSSRLAAAVGSDRKAKLSTLMYGSAIPLAFVDCWLSVALYAGVSAIWFIPDRRIESKLKKDAP
jgi:uncharacterized membrane protein